MIKTPPTRPQVLRSKPHDLVHQEIWAYLIVHHAPIKYSECSASAPIPPGHRRRDVPVCWRCTPTAAVPFSRSPVSTYADTATMPRMSMFGLLVA